MKMWSLYNNVLKTDLNSKFSINRFEDIFNFDTGVRENRLKIKLINELIQIERPTFWSKHKVSSIITEMKAIEKYISLKNKLKSKEYNKIWN
jgi:hypothetical protein